jgi:hypothetical protein
MPRPRPIPDFVCVTLFSPEEGHGFFIFNVSWAIHDGNNFALGTDRFTDTHTLGNVIEVAFRRVPITPDFKSHLVVRHRTPFRRRSLVRNFHSILAEAFGPFNELTTRQRRLRPRPRVA